MKSRILLWSCLKDVVYVGTIDSLQNSLGAARQSLKHATATADFRT